jgi:hypothetical protein
VIYLSDNIEYILHQADFCEFNLLFEKYYHKHKDEWEQARFISHSIYQSNSTKNLKLTDVLQFEWDNENSIEQHEATQEERESLIQKMKQAEKELNEKLQKQ